MAASFIIEVQENNGRWKPMHPPAGVFGKFETEESAKRLIHLLYGTRQEQVRVVSLPHSSLG